MLDGRKKYEKKDARVRKRKKRRVKGEKIAERVK